MSIHIIIDGYNLIRQSNALSDFDNQSLQLGREALIDKLVAYKKIKRHKITVVFDGINSPSFLQHSDYIKGIKIIFSQQGESADAVIKKMSAMEKEKALIVSSDNDISSHASANGAATINSKEFEKKVEMASYMDIKGIMEETPEWDPSTQKKGPKKRLSKKNRRANKKLSKL
jgi:predicted RNA-binding protein with PIN domain